MRTSVVKSLKSVIGAAFLVSFALAPSQAQAGTITYNLTGDNCSGTCGTAPFLSVTLTENGADTDFVVHLLNAQKFIKAGKGVLGENTFMFNATGVVLSDIVGGDLLGHSPALIAVDTPFGKNAFGTFGFGIRSNGGKGSSAGWSDDLTFTVKNAAIEDFVANAMGNRFAADVLGNNDNTGAVYGGTPVGTPEGTGTSVPDGGMTLTLLTGALAVLYAVRRGHSS